MEIYPGIEIINGLASRQYLIREPNQLTLIDAGLPGDAKKIVKTIQATIPSSACSLQILITHADGDHYGGVNSVKDHYFGTIVKSSDIEAKAMRSGTSSRKIEAKGVLGILFNLAGKIIRADPTDVEGGLKEGMILPVMGGLKILDTSGHTPGHISFFLINHGVLFAGDSILVHGDKLLPSSGANTWDLDKARNAFDTQLALQPEIIAGGHGWINR